MDDFKVTWFKIFNGCLVYAFWANDGSDIWNGNFHNVFIKQATDENITIENGTKVIFDCTNEGVGTSEVNSALQNMRSNGLDIDIRVLYNAVIDAPEPYQYRCQTIHMTDHCNFLGHLQKHDVKWEDLLVNKYFIALMRRASISRATITKSLLDTFDHDKFLVSCGSGYDYHARGSQQALEPYKLPIMLDKSPRSMMEQHCLNNEDFFKCFINVVVETSSQTDPMTWRTIFITEKSFKVFAYRQVGIWFAVPGLVDEVRNLGFDVYDDIIDHSYDSIQDPSTRHQAVINTLKDFVDNNDINSMRELRKQLWPRMNANVELLYKLRDSVKAKRHQLLSELAV